MTPRAVVLLCEARSLLLDREHNDRAWLAWNIAALTRAKRMPKLQSLMAKRRRRRPQTPDEQRNAMRMIAATFGGLK